MAVKNTLEFAHPFVIYSSRQIFLAVVQMPMTVTIATFTLLRTLMGSVYASPDGKEVTACIIADHAITSATVMKVASDLRMLTVYTA
jgi:hypothetical protein